MTQINDPAKRQNNKSRQNSDIDTETVFGINMQHSYMGPAGGSAAVQNPISSMGSTKQDMGKDHLASAYSTQGSLGQHAAQNQQVSTLHISGLQEMLLGNGQAANG